MCYCTYKVSSVKGLGRADLEVVVIDGRDGSHLTLRVEDAHMGQVYHVEGHLQKKKQCKGLDETV